MKFFYILLIHDFDSLSHLKHFLMSYVYFFFVFFETSLLISIIPYGDCRFSTQALK
jgi:hypothetical protein